jgi:superfamily II DNA/RNA helicase
MSSVTFADLGIHAPFDVSLARLGITEPTPIQQQAIPLLLEGRDLVASAPTGTGKTAAFLLPALSKIAQSEGARGRGPRILVLTPTRELAQQVAKASQGFSRGLQRTSTVCVTGGESYLIQNKLLAAPHEVLIATPGRLMDQMNSGRIDLSRVQVFVLDEADRMLDMGFSEDVFAIGGALPRDRQTVCFSATLSRGVRELTGQLMNNPEWITVERQQEETSSIDQHVLYVDSFDHRHRLLEACLADEGLGQAIVFTATKVHAEELAGQLEGSGHAAVALHGDLNQRQRTRALNRLRRGDCRVLVATDVAARGIDVSTVTHVINFNLPKFAEDYVHRIGRTGRAGASGQALSFVGREDVFTLRKIEHFIGRKVQVSAIEGFEASFKPTERKPRDGKGGGSFRKPGFGDKRRGKPGFDRFEGKGGNFQRQAEQGDRPGFAEARFSGERDGFAAKSGYSGNRDKPGFGNRGDFSNRSDYGQRTDFANRSEGRGEPAKRGNFGDRNQFANRGNFGDRSDTGNRAGFGHRGGGDNNRAQEGGRGFNQGFANAERPFGNRPEGRGPNQQDGAGQAKRGFAGNRGPGGFGDKPNKGYGDKFGGKSGSGRFGDKPGNGGTGGKPSNGARGRKPQGAGAGRWRDAA